jgi:hypothetical protein
MMTWEAILLFLLKLGSRRQIKWLLGSEPDALLSHLVTLTKEDISHLRTIASDDTLNDLFQRLDVHHLQQIEQNMVRHLIRQRTLEHARLLDQYYLIAFDGTGLFHRHTPHCAHCLVSKSKSGELLYSHHVLEAKLITAGGLALSIASEHIENLDGDCYDLTKEKGKQDCELKAFKRLAPLIKQAFPRLRICLLIDSLYAAETIMSICKEFDWAYVICFKEGSIPSVFQEFESLRALQPQNHCTWETTEAHQNICWTTDMDYRNHGLHVVECVERNKADDQQKTFLYLTNIKPAKSTVCALANGAGRQRWKIENQGFNMQKNGGYNLEHVYSHNENAAKCFYACLQIAHTINQLIEKGDLIENACKKFGSIKNLTFHLLEAIRLITIEPADIESLMRTPFQIRLDINSS